MPYKTSFDITMTPEDQIEICHKAASKGFALKTIADYYKISPDEVIAIGDGGNDLSMIEFAGIGIAMENDVYHGIKKFIKL